MQILIADDQKEVRSALRLLLEQQAEGCSIYEATNRDCLLSEAGRLNPDIIILDAELPGFVLKKNPEDLKSLQAAIADLRFLCPDARLVVLTSRPDLHKPGEPCQADILISKADPPEALLRAIDILCCG